MINNVVLDVCRLLIPIAFDNQVYCAFAAIHNSIHDNSVVCGEVYAVSIPLRPVVSVKGLIFGYISSKKYFAFHIDKLI